MFCLKFQCKESIGQVAGGRRRGQIGKVDDGSVCKVLDCDQQTESYRIARSESGWHCDEEVRDGWIGARNALVMMPDDAVQQADEGAKEPPPPSGSGPKAEADVMGDGDAASISGGPPPRVPTSVG